MEETFPPKAHVSPLFPRNRLRILTRQAVHNSAYPCDNHDHDYFEIVLVRGGRAMHRSLYGSKPIKRGDVLLLPPGVWHGYTNLRQLEIFNCCVGPEVFQHSLPFLSQDPFWSNFLSPTSTARQSQWQDRFAIPGDALPELEGNFQMLAELVGQPFGFQTNYRLLGVLIVILGQLADNLRSQAKLTAVAPTMHPIIQRSLALVEENLGLDWRVPDICKALDGINASYFIRLFKRNTGLTPKAYITQRRIEKAALQLLITDDSVRDIAITLGWNDPNLFSRTFRQHFNTTPTEYRAARR